MTPTAFLVFFLSLKMLELFKILTKQTYPFKEKTTLILLLNPLKNTNPATVKSPTKSIKNETKIDPIHYPILIPLFFPTNPITKN